MNYQIRKNLRKLFFLHLFSLLGIGSFAQRLPYTFDQLKVSNNSLENTVSCMLKDQNGYLWLGTASGLKRYDSGYSTIFKQKKNDDNSLIHNFVEALCEDKQGRIWVGTTEGICYFDKKKNHFVQFKELNKPDYACLNIMCDSRGDIWFSIRDKGLYRFDTKTNQLHNFSHEGPNPQRLTSNRVFRKGLIEDPHKNGIWISCSETFNFFDFATQNIYNQEFNPKKIEILNLPTIAALTINENKLVFVDNTTQEIIWYDTKLQKKTKVFSLTTNKNISLLGAYQLFFDSNNNIWLSTYEKKMAFIDLKKQEIIAVEYEKGNNTSFSAYHFLDVFQEKNGTIWFATLNGISTINGMAALKPNSKLFDVYDFSKTIFKNNPNDGFINLTDDNKDNTWWMITLNRLIKYNPSTNQYNYFQIPVLKNIPPIYNYPLYIHDYHNQLLIIKPFTLCIFDKSTKKFSELKLNTKIDFPDDKTIAISHTRLLVDSLWIFVGNSPVIYNYHLIKKQWKTYPLVLHEIERIKALKRGFAVSHSVASRSGEFWLAVHNGGLVKFSDTKQAFISVKTKQNIDFSKVGYTGFVEDKNGKFWLGTYDLIKFDPTTNDFQTAVEMDLIASLAIDDQDNLCMASLDDIMFFNEKKNEKYYYTLQNKEPYYNWTNKLVKIKNNKIISLNRQGLALIDFKNRKVFSFEDQLYISKVIYDDTTILIHENQSRLTFKSDRNSFAVHFGLLSPPNSNLYKFQYQLQGYDKDWIDAQANTNYAVFSNLSGGDYVFCVKAMDSNKKFLPTQSILIHIDTPFYKTFWFRLLCFFAIAGVGFAFFRYRTNQRKKIHHLQMQSTRLEKDKTEIQYQNLINHLNPHFLFNSLTSLNGLILSEPDTASVFLQKLSKIYRYILQNKDKEIVSLDQELAFVKNYIDLQKSRFEDGLQVNITIEEESLTSGIVPVTLQNLFENAIKHNTIEEEKPLFIDVFIENEHLIVKNNLQKKKFVETSNKQGLDSLKSLYKYLTSSPLGIIETETEFIVKVPLI